MRAWLRPALFAAVLVGGFAIAAAHVLQSGVESPPATELTNPGGPRSRPATSVPQLEPPTAPSSESDPDDTAKSGQATWGRFIEACERRDFPGAKQLVGAVQTLPLQTRLSGIPVAAGLDLSDSEAAVLGKIVQDVLLHAADDGALQSVLAIVVAEIERHWPAPDKLQGERARLYTSEVQGRPVAVPERLACVPADRLLAAVYLSASSMHSDPSAIHALFERAAGNPWKSRAYLEPALSAILGLLRDQGDTQLAILAGKFKDAAGLTERLRWELRLLSMAGTPVAELLALLDGLADRNDVFTALQNALRAGLSTEDILGTLVPYLVARFDRLVAVNLLATTLIMPARSMSEEGRTDFARSAATEFCRADSGSVLADAYLAVFQSADIGRSMALRETGVSERHRFLDPGDQRTFRVAVLAHWRNVGMGLREGEIPKVSASTTCLALIEACPTLAEAVEAIEEFIATCHRHQQRSSLVQGWWEILARCQSFYPSEMTRERELRARLVAATEQLLQEPPESTRLGPAQARARACQGVRLVDELLSICAMEPVVSLTRAAAASLREKVAEFERLAFVDDGDRRALPRELQRTYEAPYLRAVQRLKDGRFVPQDH